MRLPDGGRLVARRVVTDLAEPLRAALDRELTGYARLSPQDALLLDGDGAGVLTFTGGVPAVAYHTATDAGGPEALAHLAGTGPYRLELYALDPGVLGEAHDEPALRVSPAAPAEQLVGDADLAARTREAAPDRLQHGGDTARERDTGGSDAVVAFLEDSERVAAIQRRARAEAEQRAAEWDL